jgi:hypothetical protein
VVDVPLPLRRHPNPARHVRMKATEIIYVAHMLQRDATGPVRRYSDVPVFVARRRRMRDEVNAHPFDRVATWAETCVGVNLSLSIVMRIVSAAGAGAAHAIAPHKLTARSFGPIGSSYFSDWATRSACCS